MSEKVAAAARKMFLYLAVGSSIVVQEAEDHFHLEQAFAAEGKPKPKYVAGTLQPLSKEEIAGLEKRTGLTFDGTPQKALPAYIQAAPKPEEKPFGGKLDKKMPRASASHSESQLDK